MRFDKQVERREFAQIWDEYCGFINMNIDEYMQVQSRLLTEQLRLLQGSALGRKLVGDQPITSIDQFRKTVPLTTYDDYADVLLQKREDQLPAPTMAWIQTTWEGGKHPVKFAPYTAEMLNVYRRNLISAMILATSSARGSFSIRPHDRILYGLAPLPYATGLFPHVIKGHLSLDFLPPVELASTMGFSASAKLGFKMGVYEGVDLFFGMASVAAKISTGFSLDAGGGRDENYSRSAPTLKMLTRILKAKLTKGDKQIRPKDIFTMKGLVVAGTDSDCYKDLIEQYWGVRPSEVAGGTESTCVGTELWNKDGMIFFPDASFYEFIPESEANRSIDEPGFVPNTYLMNELRPGETYELVLSVFHGGAFVRYRIGDMYRCQRIGDRVTGVSLPFLSYVDRTPDVIDIAGFTRITKDTISEVLKFSRLELSRYVAIKEYDQQRRPFLHMYVEVDPDSMAYSAATAQVIKEHLSVYFRYVDDDYKDLKRLLGIDPLQVDILPIGTIEGYEARTGRPLRCVNPHHYDVVELLRNYRGAY